MGRRCLRSHGRHEGHWSERVNIRCQATPGDSTHFLAAAKHDAGQTKIRHEGLRTLEPGNPAFVDFAPSGIKRTTQTQGIAEKVTSPRVRFVRMQGEAEEEQAWMNRILRITRKLCRCFITL